MLTSRPAVCGRLNSTSCLDSPLAAIPGVQPLPSGLRFADFSGDLIPVPYSGDGEAGGGGTGPGALGGRMLILMNIKKLLNSDEMALLDVAASHVA